MKPAVATVPCPKCGAPRGFQCRQVRGGETRHGIPDIHWARRRAHQVELERRAQLEVLEVRSG